jgi:hypothetical protein
MSSTGPEVLDLQVFGKPRKVFVTEKGEICFTEQPNESKDA